MRLCILLIFSLLAITKLSAQEALTVNASGVGATAEAAEKSALINAVQQAVGLYIDNETLVKNEKLVFDSILSLSDGFVTKYSVKTLPHKRLADGLFETTISAIVQKGKVGIALQKSNLVQGLDFKDIWAEAVTSVKSAQDAVEVLTRKVPQIVTALVTAQLVDAKGSVTKQVRPEIRPDPSNGHAWCAWNVRISYDRDTYYEKAVPLLKMALNALADRKLPDLNVKLPSAVHLNTSSTEPDFNTRRTSLLNTLARFPGRIEYAWPNLDTTQDIMVCLNYASDKSRENLRFHAWVLNRKLYEKWLRDMFTPKAVKMSFLDEKGQTVSEGMLQIEKGTLFAPTGYNSGVRQGLMGPTAVPVRVVATPLAYWESTNGSSSVPLLWLTPDFRARNDVSLAGNWVHLSPVVDSLLRHYELSFEPDDIKRMKTVRFSVVPGQSEY